MWRRHHWELKWCTAKELSSCCPYICLVASFIESYVACLTFLKSFNILNGHLLLLFWLFLWIFWFFFYISIKKFLIEKFKSLKLNSSSRRNTIASLDFIWVNSVPSASFILDNSSLYKWFLRTCLNCKGCLSFCNVDLNVCKSILLSFYLFLAFQGCSLFRYQRM